MEAVGEHSKEERMEEAGSDTEGGGKWLEKGVSAKYSNPNPFLKFSPVQVGTEAATLLCVADLLCKEMTGSASACQV
jgi:hypothetical protein